MLSDYGPQIYVPKRFRQAHTLIVHLTKTGGVASLDTPTSSPGVSLLTQPGSGVYTFSGPGGLKLHYVGGGIDPNTSSPAAGVGTIILPRLLNPADSSVSGKSTWTLVVHASDGTEVDFADSGHLYATLLLGKA